MNSGRNLLEKDGFGRKQSSKKNVSRRKCGILLSFRFMPFTEYHSGFLRAGPLTRIVKLLNFRLEKTSSENKVLFSELAFPDLNHFSFYFENVAKAISTDENRAQIFSGYLRGGVF